MNRDTEIFVVTKELEQAQKEFEQSLGTLEATVKRAVEGATAAYAKLEKATQRALTIVKSL